MTAVRLNPYHPLRSRVTHAIVMDGLRAIDLTGRAYKWTRPLQSANNRPTIEPRTGLTAVNFAVGSPDGQQTGVLEPLAERIAGAERLTTFALHYWAAAGLSGAFSLQRTTASASGTWGENPSSGAWIRYNVSDGRMSYSNHTVGWGLYSMSFDGSFAAANRLIVTRDGQEIGTLFGTMPTVVDSQLTRICIGENPAYFNHSAGAPLAAFLVMRDVRMEAAEAESITRDWTSFVSLFRGPTVQVMVPPSAPVGSTGNFAGSIAEPIGAFTGIVRGTGNFAGVIAEPVGALTGIVRGQGNFAGIIAEPIGAFVGTAPATGNFAGSIAEPVGAFTGDVLVTGNFAGAIAEPVGAFVGTVDDGVNAGDFAGVIAEPIGAFVGSVEVTGDFAGSIAEPVGAFTGIIRGSGNFAGTIQEPIGAFVGVVEDASSTGGFTGVIAEPVGAFAGSVTGLIPEVIYTNPAHQVIIDESPRPVVVPDDTPVHKVVLRDS